jgi:DHA2 family multidrug resistance protein
VQSVLGFTATMSGQLFLVQAGTSGVLTFISVGLLQSGLVQARYLVGMGFLLLGLGNWLLFHIYTPQTDFHAFVIPLMVLGLGLSQIFVPLTIASVGAVPEEIVPDAAAFTNLARQLGGSVSTALLVTIAQRASTADYAHLASGLTLANPAVAHYAMQNGGAAKVAGDLFTMVQTQSTVLGYGEAALITAVVSALLAPLALLMGRANPAAISAAA